MKEFDQEFANSTDMTDAQRAADYTRQFGFEKAADYIQDHYIGGEFDPDKPIPIATRNMRLEGSQSKSGVPFERCTAKLTDGLEVEGVVPKFESRHHVELGEKANDMTVYQQFAACRDDFQQHMFDSPEKLQGLTFDDMTRLDEPQGFAPKGWTFNHNLACGSYDLVPSDKHKGTGHTGGNALYGATHRTR